MEKPAEHVLCVILLVALLTAASACSPYGGNAAALAVEPAVSFAIPDDIQESSVQVSHDANEFAFEFTSGLLRESDPHANFVCSPYSAWLPLAALVGATDTAKRPQLLEALGVAGVDAAQLNAAVRDVMSALTCAQENYWREKDGLDPFNPLSIVNAVFADDDARISSDFAEIFADNYGGAVFSVDFGSNDAANEINAWAAAHTDGLIPRVVQSFPADTKAAIANAIYYSDRWALQFDESDTAPGVFHGPGGDSQAYYMRHEGPDQAYFQDDSLQAVRLGFRMGGSMLILLPQTDDAASILAGMTDDRLSSIMSSVQPAGGTLLLPRFDLSSDIIQISNVLGALGIPLFDSSDPAVTGLVDDEALYISQAVQCASIRVDEQGTTAAAVTALAVNSEAMSEPAARFEMVCNRPFAFILLGNGPGGADQVLFTGIVNEPDSGGKEEADAKNRLSA